MSSPTVQLDSAEIRTRADERAARRRANYALALLAAIYACNFVDRQILAILLEPVKRELGASDSAMGLLTGPAFAVFYAAAGIPIARWADRGVRRDIVALGVAVWSAMTVFSGLARSFAQLAAARIGVGLGEAACTPPAHSMIADLFPPAQRARAMAVYSSGIHVGILLALVAGGWIEQSFGWRAAFAIVGVPGLLLAVLARFTLSEPARSAPVERTPARDAWLALASVASLRWIAAAGAVASITGYAFVMWTPAFLGRVHGMSSAQIGTSLGLIQGLAGAAGTLAGGWLADRLAREDVRWRAWIPALAAALAGPLFLLAVAQESRAAALFVLVPSTLLQGLWLAPTFGLVQSLAPPGTRALASSVLILAINVIGLGFGPWLVGALNDALAERFGSGAVRASLAAAAAFDLAAAALFLAAAQRLRGFPFTADATRGRIRA